MQCTNYNHIAKVFPPLSLLDTHDRLFRRPSAAYNSVNPGSFSKWRPAKDVKYRRRTRVQISVSEAFAKKISLRIFVTHFVTTSVTLINCTLVCGNPVYAHGRVYYGRSQPGLRPDPGCARNNSVCVSKLPILYKMNWCDDVSLRFVVQCCQFSAERQEWWATTCHSQDETSAVGFRSTQTDILCRRIACSISVHGICCFLCKDIQQIVLVHVPLSLTV